MVVTVPTNKSVESFEGLHLFHGAISNCSMRVRMTLIEKGLDWTSHHIDLKKKENISDDYFGINPNGLVPTLVDNGVVHIESNDIIDYIDETYPEPTLRASENEDMMEWLHLAAAIHVPACKPYVYATKMAAKLKKTAEEQEKYDSLQKNEELKQQRIQRCRLSEGKGNSRSVLCQARSYLGGSRLDHGRSIHSRRHLLDPSLLRDLWLRLFVRQVSEHPALGRGDRGTKELSGRRPQVVSGFR